MAELSRCNSSTSFVEASDCESGLASPHFLSGLKLLMAPRTDESIIDSDVSPVIPFTKLTQILTKKPENPTNKSTRKECEESSIDGHSHVDLSMENLCPSHQSPVDQTEIEDDNDVTCSEVSDILCTIAPAGRTQRVTSEFDKNETLESNKGLDKSPNFLLNPVFKPCSIHQDVNENDNNSDETQDVVILETEEVSQNKSYAHIPRGGFDTSPNIQPTTISKPYSSPQDISDQKSYSIEDDDIPVFKTRELSPGYSKQTPCKKSRENKRRTTDEIQVKIKSCNSSETGASQTYRQKLQENMTINNIECASQETIQRNISGDINQRMKFIDLSENKNSSQGNLSNGSKSQETYDGLLETDPKVKSQNDVIVYTSTEQPSQMPTQTAFLREIDTGMNSRSDPMLTDMSETKDLSQRNRSNSSRSEETQGVPIINKKKGSQKKTKGEETFSSKSNPSRNEHNETQFPFETRKSGVSCETSSADKPHLQTVAELKEKHLKRHEQELCVISRASKQLECGENILLSGNTAEAAETVHKTLNTLQKMLTSLSSSHKYERFNLVEKIKAKHLGKEDKQFVKHQGKLLQERQGQLLLLFRKHQNLSEKLKICSVDKDSRKFSQTRKSHSSSSSSATGSEMKHVASRQTYPEKAKLGRAEQTSDKPIVQHETLLSMKITDNILKQKPTVDMSKTDNNLVHGGAVTVCEVVNNEKLMVAKHEENDSNKSAQKQMSSNLRSNCSQLEIIKNRCHPPTRIPKEPVTGSSSESLRQCLNVLPSPRNSIGKIIQSGCDVTRIHEEKTLRCDSNMEPSPQSHLRPNYVFRTYFWYQSTSCVTSVAGTLPSKVPVSGHLVSTGVNSTSQPVNNTGLNNKGKRPMPKQVADVNILMSPDSSVDFSVAASPKKSRRTIFQAAAIKKVTPDPVKLTQQIVVTQQPKFVKPVPVKRICQSVEYPTQVSSQPKDLPELRELLSAGVLKAGVNVLSLFTGTRSVYASLTEAGFIQSTGGELFRTPMQWYSALLCATAPRNYVRKLLAYDKVLYNGTPLSQFRLPQPCHTIIDEVINIVNLESKTDARSASLPKQLDNSTITPERIQLRDTLKHCTVRILSNVELIPNKPVLPDDFWKVQVPSEHLPKELLDCIDVW